jgi:hypothetical protein
MQLSIIPKQKYQFFFALGIVFFAFGIFSTMSALKNEEAIKQSIRDNRNAIILRSYASDDRLSEERMGRRQLEPVLKEDLEQAKHSGRRFFITIFGISCILIITGFLMKSRADARKQNDKK